MSEKLVLFKVINNDDSNPLTAAEMVKFLPCSIGFLWRYDKQVLFNHTALCKTKMSKMYPVSILMSLQKKRKPCKTQEISKTKLQQ